MTATRWLMIPALLAVLSGCGRQSSATFTAVSTTTTSSNTNSYRALDRAKLETLLKEKCGYSEVTLTPGAPDRYSGSCKGPDGTELPIAVVVEDDQIIAETKTPAGTTRNTIPAKGDVKSELMVK